MSEEHVVELGQPAGIVRFDAKAVAAPTAEEVRSLGLHNNARDGRGIVRLAWNEDLYEAALAHARDMLARGYFSHDSEDGTRFSRRVRRAGYAFRVCAENIAWGSGERGGAEAIFRSWMGSEGHRKNVLDPRVREVGIACAVGTFRGFRNARIWVADFGAR